MSSLSKQFSNFSIYDVRKAARSAQNSLFASNSPIELMIRNATNTDPWGPSSKELEEIRSEMYMNDHEEVVGLLFGRITEYLNASSPVSTRKQTFYNRAVHYVNSGNEWRIILKSLRVIEYLLLHSDTNEYDQAVRDNSSVLKRILRVYENESTSSSIVTTAELEKKEHASVLVKITTEIQKLLDDETYRAMEVSKALKTSNLGSVGNKAVVFRPKNDTVSGFKTKQLNTSKMQNSNAKSEARNYIGHYIHTKKRLPGKYTGFEGDQLTDEAYDSREPYDNPYDDFFVADEAPKPGKSAFKDDAPLEHSEDDDGYQEALVGDEGFEDEEFGDFQESKHSGSRSNSKESEQFLVSIFDNEPVTPTAGTSSKFDTLMTASHSPTAAKFSAQASTDTRINISTTPKSKDTFADLFQSAKTPK